MAGEELVTREAAEKKRRPLPKTPVEIQNRAEESPRVKSQTGRSSLPPSRSSQAEKIPPPLPPRQRKPPRPPMPLPVTKTGDNPVPAPLAPAAKGALKEVPPPVLPKKEKSAPPVPPRSPAMLQAQRERERQEKEQQEKERQKKEQQERERQEKERKKQQEETAYGNVVGKYEKIQRDEEVLENHKNLSGDEGALGQIRAQRIAADADMKKWRGENYDPTDAKEKRKVLNEIGQKTFERAEVLTNRLNKDVNHVSRLRELRKQLGTGARLLEVLKKAKILQLNQTGQSAVAITPDQDLSAATKSGLTDTSQASVKAIEPHAERGDKMSDYFVSIVDSLIGAVGSDAGIADKFKKLKNPAAELEAAKSTKEKWTQLFDAKEGGNHASWAAMATSLLNVGLAALQIIAVKRKIKQEVDLRDEQETLSLKRKKIGKVIELVKSLLGFVGPFLGAIPVLGPILDGIGCVLDIGNASYNYHYDLQYKNKSDELKLILWRKIDQKRKKYEKEAAGTGMTPEDKELAEDSSKFYFIDARQEKGGFLNTFYQGARSDKKRRQLMAGAADSMRIADIRTDAEIRKVSRNASRFEQVNEGVSSKISEFRSDYKKEKSRGGMQKGSSAYREYKLKERRLEALQLMNQLRVADKAAKRGEKKLHREGESIGTAVLSLIGNFISFLSEVSVVGAIGATVGEGLKAVVSSYNATRAVGGLAYKGIRKATGSEKSKSHTRDQLGKILFDQMSVLGDAGKFGTEHKFLTGSEDTIAPTEESYKIKEFTEGSAFILTSRQGLDLAISSLLKAGTKNDMIASLASAFSQGGN